MPRKYQAAAATIVIVTQPSVPEWTCVSNWSRLKSTASRPFRIPIAIVIRTTAIAVR